MLGGTELSPVVTPPGRGRALAFVAAFLLVAGGLGYTWLQHRTAAITTQSTAAPAQAAPPPGQARTGPVIDEADVLSDQTERQLAGTIKRLKADLGPEMVVLTVPDLQHRSIEAFAFERFNRMALGDRNRNDGVLLLIAPNQHQVRLEVGKGLTTVLSSEASQHIIDRTLPLFRAGQTDAAAIAGVDGVVDDLHRLSQFLPGKAQ
ncbi:MAG: TPM domain-containing protein [Novosphingobium sp.]